MKHWLLLTILLISTVTTLADTKEFVRDYTYIASDADSKISARKMAMQEVKRELLNEIGTHIYSRIDISENSKGEADAKQEIRAITAGIVKVEVIEEKWDGYKFYIKAKMAAAPKEILGRIKELASNDNENTRLKGQLNQSTKAFEDLRLEMLALKKLLDESKSQQEKQKVAQLYSEKTRHYREKKEKRLDYYEPYSAFKKPTDKELGGASFALGNMYRKGKGAQQSDEQAVYWYKDAAGYGSARAQYALGTMYEIGKGVQRSDKQAVYWFQMAAKQGATLAQYNLGLMYDNGKGVKQNYKLAVYWLQKAAEKGDASAQNHLAFMYYKGRGVLRSGKLSDYWWQKAEEQGHDGELDVLKGI